MAVAGCINAYDCNGCLIQTLQNLDSACIGVGVQYTAPNPLDDKRLDYIKYTDKCGCTCCLSAENEILIYATDGVIKNLTLTNDDVNEAIKIKWNDIFGSNRAKTIVRYKTGSAPVSITDGTLAVEETTKNQYSSTPFSLTGVLDETTYYITAFAVDSNNTVISSQTASVTTEFGWHPSANTLFYIKNDGNITDHSQFAHGMTWYGTSKFFTLGNGRKVADFDGTNMTRSTNKFTEANGYTTFTMHIWLKNKSSSISNVIGGWRGRNGSSISTTDRWGALVGNNGNGKEYVSWGATNGYWQDTGNNALSPDTSNFYLYTFTINGKTVKIYKNAVLQYTYTGSYNIIGGSNTGTFFYLGGHYAYDSGIGSQEPCYMGEVALEKIVETDAQILEFYNKTKNHYV